MQNQRFIVLSFFLAALLIAATLRGLGTPLLASLEVADPLVGGVANASTLIAVAVGVTSFFFLLRNSTSFTFTDEAIDELRKTTWPGKEETIRSTMVVIGATTFIAVVLASYDLVWAKVTSTFLFTEG